MACSRICSCAACWAAVISAARGPAYQGVRWISAGLMPVASSSAVPGRQGADGGGFEDVLPAQRHRLAGPPVAVVEGADGDVVLADQGGQVAGQAG